MHAPAPERRVGGVAAAGAALVLIVVLASAIIRIGQQAVPPLGDASLMALRAVHRTAASLEVLAMLALAWLLWLVLPQAYVAMMVISAALWSAAFAVFTVVYLPILSRPRLDGQPGL